MGRGLPLAERVIPVYVRKGERADERVLSFPLPDDVPQSHILTAGMALDGNAVLTGVGFDHDRGVYRHPALRIIEDASQEQIELAGILNGAVDRRLPEEETGADLGEERPRGCYLSGHTSLADALNCVQSLLVIWLYAYKYSPKFT